MNDSPIVRVAQGQLQGRLASSPTGRAFYSFQGIPYAKPPIGSLRFKAPQPPESWEGIRDATSEGNVCAQMDLYSQNQYTGDENCLFLNVYTPSIDGELLPVMIYIHGGYFAYGSGNSNQHGADYLVEKDVVVVTINYRCGALGFLSLNTPEVPGNAGLKDMVQAIRWIKENIKSFGGNAENLTVFGNSAGGASTTLLTASPLSKNLFGKAISQSGTALNFWVFQKNALENAKSLAKELGCESSNTDEILEFLSTTPVRDVVEAANAINSVEILLKTRNNKFGPVIEKEFPGVEAFLTEAFFDLLISGRVADIPIMIGTTSLEITIDADVTDLQVFIPDILHIERNSPESLAIADQIQRLYFKGTPTPEEISQLLSDVTFNVDVYRYIQYLVNVTNRPIYHYKFDYIGDLNVAHKLLKSIGLKDNACQHLDELGYLFRNDLHKDIVENPQDIKMRERLVRLWTNFAKYGNPTPDKNHYLTVTWLPVTKDKLNYIHLSNELSINSDPDKEKMEFWDNLYVKYFKIWDQPSVNQEPTIDTTPVIVQETIVTTVTTVVDSYEEEKVEGHVSVDVQDTAGVPEQDVLVIENLEIKDSVQDDEAVNENQNGSVDVQQEVEIEERQEDIQKNGINIVEIQEKFQNQNGDYKFNGNVERKPRPSNEIKMVQNSNINPKDVIRANDPPEDDLPKNIGVNKFVNFFESLGGKK
ncbi:carboxylic ester hydrolase-like isoform X2 [Danaus plexippus]|nr:carboxylic ester hydrolase-like isoform X2 [Danaus plexippus]